ncbi:MAG: cell division protein FtsZ [Thermoplasmata archaeon]
MKTLIDNALSKDNEGIQNGTDGASDQELAELLEGLKTNIYIVGLGGAGCNTIDRISEEGIQGAKLIAGNTDAQHLLSVDADRKVLLGRNTTRGLGAGAKPEVGKKACEEALDDIKDIIQEPDIVFLTCGMGGGTGTGSIIPVAEYSKKIGALTIAIVTKPFSSEGRSRMKNAAWGIKNISHFADTVITVENDKLLEIAPRLSLNNAFKLADEILMYSIKGMTELVSKPGLVNLDYNDLRTVMDSSGHAVIGMGESTGRGDIRAKEAIEKAINSPLINADITGANGALLNITGGSDMSVREAETVVEEIERMVNPDAKIIWGCNVDPALKDKMRVMVVATGIKRKLKRPDAEESEENIKNVY